jgi:hypothetical protein
MLSAIAEPCELWSMNLGQFPSDIDNQKVSFALECLLRLWLNYRREIYEMGAKIWDSSARVCAMRGHGWNRRNLVRGRRFSSIVCSCQWWRWKSNRLPWLPICVLEGQERDKDEREREERDREHFSCFPVFRDQKINVLSNMLEFCVCFPLTFIF